MNERETELERSDCLEKSRGSVLSVSQCLRFRMCVLHVVQCAACKQETRVGRDSDQTRTRLCSESCQTQSHHHRTALSFQPCSLPARSTPLAWSSATIPPSVTLRASRNGGQFSPSRCSASPLLFYATLLCFCSTILMVGRTELRDGDCSRRLSPSSMALSRPQQQRLLL
jgi:hypothetical protein